MLLPILAAAALALPTPSMPFAAAAFSNKMGDASIEIFVGPDGKVLECRVLLSEASQEENARDCMSLIGRDSGTGARGPDGQSAYGVIVFSRVRHFDYGGREALPTDGADLEIDVSQMPGKESRKRIRLMAYIDESGRIQDCLPATRSDAAFARVACQQAIGNVFPIKKGVVGQPVKYVTELGVDFVRDGTTH